jgi:hypothetical protein
VSSSNTPQVARLAPDSTPLELPRQGEAPLVEQLPPVQSRQNRRLGDKIDRDVARLAATVLVLAVFAYAVVVALLLN